MGGLARSWAIAKVSWRVLLEEQGLLLFPVLSGILTVFAAVAFVIPVAMIAGLTGSASASGSSSGSLTEGANLVLLFAFYLVTSFITLFFNTALVAVALERLRGNDPRVGDGFRVAGENLGSIFVFAVVSATVGVVLRLIEEKWEMVGTIVASILGAGWAVVTFLVVPVMVAERSDALTALRRSSELLRATWGAQLGGNLGIGLIVFLLLLLGLVPIALGFAIGIGPAILLGIGLAILYWVLVAVVASALGQIYRAAVYLYAATGVVPSQFDEWMVQQAFRAR